MSLPSWRSSSREKEQSHLYDSPHLNSSIRSFSAVSNEENKKPSYRDRAREGAAKADAVARKGARVARKGATTASGMIRQYGPVFVGTYFTIYWMSWGAIFCGMDSGLIDPVQIMGYISGGVEDSKSTVHVLVEYLEKYDLTKPYAETVQKNPHIANLGVAWVANKFTEPVRLMLTIGIVPRLARHFGFVVPKEDETNENDESSTTTTDKATSCGEDMTAEEKVPEEKVSESTSKRH
jgi:hypothetical protein